MNFYGKTYSYNTPNHGPQEIGVCSISGGKHDGWMHVAWLAGNGVATEVRSAKLEPCSDARVLQQVLDAWAEKHGLQEWSQAARGAASEVLVPELAEPSEDLSTASDSAVTIAPQEVSAQYRRAVNGVLEMVRFGAMLMEVEVATCRSVTRATTGKIDGREVGLKGWLADHCPEVNYHTAMRFKRLAEGVHASCKIPAATPLRLCLPGPGGEMDAVPADVAVWTGPGRRVSDDKLRQLRQETWSLIDGKSARQLQFAFVSEAATPTGGALAITDAERDRRDPDWRHKAAVVGWSEHLSWLQADVRPGGFNRFAHLTQAELKGFLDSLTFIRDELRGAVKKHD